MNNIKNISLTYNELVMLQMIAQNGYAPTNYGVPEHFDETGPVWSELLDDATLREGMIMPEKKAFGGIVASLVKKGLAESSDSSVPKRDSSTALTEEGFKAWQEQVQNVDFTKGV